MAFSRYHLFVIMVAIIAFGFSSGVLAQGGQGRGRGPRVYDTKTETTLTGTVDAIETIPSGGRYGQGGLHLTLKTTAESIEVHLGPVAFMNEKKITVEKGDALQILGSRVTMNGKPVLIAREIKKGDETWTLRDELGRPLWSGGRRRN